MLAIASTELCELFLQHGYVAEPMSQEEHDQIAQYLTICAYIPYQSISFVVFQRKCENKVEVVGFLSKRRRQAERLVAWRNRPSS